MQRLLAGRQLRTALRMSMVTRGVQVWWGFVLGETREREREPEQIFERAKPIDDDVLTPSVLVLTTPYLSHVLRVR